MIFRPGTVWRLLLTCFALLALASAAQAESLKSVYQREIKLLEQERANLKAALLRDKKAADAAKASLKRDIEARTAALVKRQSENAGRRESLRQREERKQAAASKRSLEEIASQIRGWLTSHEVKADPALEKPSGLPKLIELALAHIRQKGALELRSGVEVFDDQGHGTKRDVLRIGGVGALTWDGQTRPLIPTTDGSLRTVSKLFSQKQTAGNVVMVDGVLYDPSKPPRAETLVQTGFRGWMKAGGPLMWVLLVLAVLATLVGVERGLVLAVVTLRWFSGRKAIWHHVREGDWSKAHQSGKGFHKNALLKPLFDLLANPGRPRNELEERATQGLIAARHPLFRRFSLLSITAAAAPLIGLLGTVTGMISTFSSITQHGTGDPRLLSGGISEALLTTQLGLAVAIPALLMRTGLSRWATRLFGRAEASALDLVHRIEDARLGIANPHDHHDHGHGHDHGHDHGHGHDDHDAEKAGEK